MNTGFQWRWKFHYIEEDQPPVLPGAAYGRWVRQPNPTVDEQLEIEGHCGHKELKEMGENVYSDQCVDNNQSGSMGLAPVFDIESGDVVQPQTIAQTKNG
jgi:hypothetical protein